MAPPRTRKTAESLNWYWLRSVFAEFFEIGLAQSAGQIKVAMEPEMLGAMDKHVVQSKFNGVTGDFKIQKSLNGSDWVDEATVTVAGIAEHDFTARHIRFDFDGISAGDVDVWMLSKRR